MHLVQLVEREGCRAGPEVQSAFEEVTDQALAGSLGQEGGTSPEARRRAWEGIQGPEEIEGIVVRREGNSPGIGAAEDIREGEGLVLEAVADVAAVAVVAAAAEVLEDQGRAGVHSLE
jgi:hypothetical protein